MIKKKHFRPDFRLKSMYVYMNPSNTVSMPNFTKEIQNKNKSSGDRSLRGDGSRHKAWLQVIDRSTAFATSLLPIRGS